MAFKTSADASLDVITTQVGYIINLDKFEELFENEGNRHKRKSVEEAESWLKDLDGGRKTCIGYERNLLEVQSLLLQQWDRHGARNLVANIFYHDLDLTDSLEDEEDSDWSDSDSDLSY